MPRLGLETQIADRTSYTRTVQRFREAGVVLPTFAEMADPSRIPAATRDALHAIDPDAPHPMNLFRVHWFNDATRRAQVEVPDHIVLTEAVTGIESPIVVALGDRFPMIHAHKVLAAYACLAPRIVTGQFDPTMHKALWPSTGNYCRGGVAISRIMRCRGVAILPAGMSEERFRWLEAWVSDPADIIRTPGTESNVKEIYDACNQLERDPSNIIFNQFCEFGNYLAHYACTGRALATVFDRVRAQQPALALRGYVSATGSAGTLAAGDYLKERYGARIAAAEALECPTLLENGFGEHNIQGIGDKHVPLIHNVMNTDFVVGVSDRSTDQLGVMLNSDEGREYLVRARGVDPALVAQLPALGLSSICNIVAAIKLAKQQGFGPRDAIVTVATDGSAMYGTERLKAIASQFGGRFGRDEAVGAFAQHMLGAGADNVLELSERDRRRIFNLGYFTWVEQQGLTLDEFVVRRDQHFWHDLRSRLPQWDEMIGAFNREVGVAVATA